VPSPASVTVQAASVATPGLTGTATVTITAPVEISVTVSPATARVRVRRSVRFRAKVGNSSDQRVTWNVNGIAGGNATVGTVSATGVYRAPAAVPASNPVKVSAVSVADPSRSAAATVTVTRR